MTLFISCRSLDSSRSTRNRQCADTSFQIPAACATVGPFTMNSSRLYRRPDKRPCRSMVAVLPTLLALLAVCFAATPLTARTASASLQPLRSGRWTSNPRGEVLDVKLSGSYAYVALGFGGFAVFDVSNPTNCLRVGGYHAAARSLAVSENYAYIAHEFGLQ